MSSQLSRAAAPGRSPGSGFAAGPHGDSDPAGLRSTRREVTRRGCGLALRSARMRLGRSVKGQADLEERVPHRADQFTTGREWCRVILPRVSRTFALSIELLPASIRDAVRTAYLLCRIVDTIEDQPGLSLTVRAQLFDAFDGMLREHEPGRFGDAASTWGLGGTAADAELCRGAGLVMAELRSLSPRQRAAIVPHVEEMSRGMRAFSARADEAGTLRLGTMEELEEYCYYVAGTVGILLTNLFELEIQSLGSESKSALRSRAVEFGLGLQLTNIVKDVAQDYARGDCFLPQNLATRRGVDLGDLLNPKHRGAALGLLREICDHARGHLRSAQEYTLLWPLPSGRAVRLFCAVPLGLALATLREVETGADTLCPGRVPKVSRQTVQRILGEATTAVGSDAALTALWDRAAAGAVSTPEAG